MGLFLLPATLCNQFGDYGQQILLGGSTELNKMNWIKWDNLVAPKKWGGGGCLGFGSFNSVHRALLAKQWWRLLRRDDSLVAQVLKARYYPKCEAVSANCGTNSSYLWKSIHAAKEIIKEGSIWKVGEWREHKYLV